MLVMVDYRMLWAKLVLRLANMKLICKYEAYGNDGYCGGNDLEKNEVIEKELEDIRRGDMFYFHLGISCSSWSILRYLSGGTRTESNPWGNGKRSDQNHGNKQLRQAAKLIRAQTQAGNYWSLEQPASSLMLSTEAMQNIMKQDGVQNTLFDQCCYGLKPFQCFFIYSEAYADNH